MTQISEVETLGGHTIESKQVVEQTTERPQAAKGKLDQCRFPVQVVPNRWDTFDPGTVFLALAVVEPDDDAFVAYSPSLPGAASQGDSPEEAVANLKEALAGCLEAYKEAGDKVPWVKDPSIEGSPLIQRWVEIRV